MAHNQLTGKNPYGPKGTVMPPYKHQAFPKMVYHKDTGIEFVADTKKDIPPNHVFERAFVGKSKKDIEAIKAERLVASKAAQLVLDKERGEHEVTFESLGIKSREEALQLLADEGVAVPKKATDEEVAILAERAMEDVNGE